MGLFWNWKKHKAAPSGTFEKQEPQTKEKPTQPVAPSGDSTLPSQPEKTPQPTKQQETPAPVDHAKPHTEIEMRKVVFRFSSHDPEKCSAFIKELLRKVNKHDWHTLSGRIGKNLDKVKMRMDIKGKHDDIESFITWCKTDNVGVHIYEVVATKAHRMPYSTAFPPFQELHGSLPTA